MQGAHNLIIYPNAAYVRALNSLSCTSTRMHTRVCARTCACVRMWRDRRRLLGGFWYLRCCSLCSLKSKSGCIKIWLFKKRENVSWECSFFYLGLLGYLCGVLTPQERASPPAAYAWSQLKRPTWFPLLCYCCCFQFCLCCPVPCNTFCMCLCCLPLFSLAVRLLGL